MIEIKENKGKIRIAFQERFELDSSSKARELLNKFLEYKEKYTKGIIAEQVSEKV